MLQQHWKDPDFLLLGTSCTHNMIKQSRDREKTFWLFPINKPGNLHLKRCSGFKGQGGRERSCEERRIEARSPQSLLRDFSLSSWIHTWDGWGTLREVPLSWDLLHVSKEIEGKCSQTSSSLQVKQEAVNQDCTASTHWTLVAKFGKASLDGWKKSPYLLSFTQADVLLFLSQKYFPALPHTLPPCNPRAAAAAWVAIRCSLLSLEAWGIAARANGSWRKLFSFPDISISS